MRNPLVSRLGTAVAAALLAVACGSATPPAEASAPATPRGRARRARLPRTAEGAGVAAHAAPARWPSRSERHVGSPGRDRVRAHSRGKSRAKNESVCIFGCAPPPGQAGAAPTGPPPEGPPGPGFPKYKPEFAAKVKDLKDRQVQVDTLLQCAPPGVPRIGPPAKIVQNAREVVFLYDDVNGPYFRTIPTDGRHASHRSRAELSR